MTRLSRATREKRARLMLTATPLRRSSGSIPMTCERATGMAWAGRRQGRRRTEVGPPGPHPAVRLSLVARRLCGDLGTGIDSREPARRFIIASLASPAPFHFMPPPPPPLRQPRNPHVAAQAAGSTQLHSTTAPINSRRTTRAHACKGRGEGAALRAPPAAARRPGRARAGSRSRPGCAAGAGPEPCSRGGRR